MFVEDVCCDNLWKIGYLIQGHSTEDYFTERVLSCYSLVPVFTWVTEACN